MLGTDCQFVHMFIYCYYLSGTLMLLANFIYTEQNQIKHDVRCNFVKIYLISFYSVIMMWFEEALLVTLFNFFL